MKKIITLVFVSSSLAGCSTMLMKNPEGMNLALESVSTSTSSNDMIRASTAAPSLDANRVKALISALSRDLRFEAGSTQLKPRALSALKELAQLISAKPSAKIAVGGHTDTSGDDKINQQLSLARARAVGSVLIQNGVAANRVAVKGYSSQKPMSKNTTASGRAFNRRAEIILN